MQNELKEVSIDPAICHAAITRSLDESVHWFLFVKDDGQAIGTCHLQSVHRYWGMERRYYLGSFYLTLESRGRGYFKDIYSQLKEWVSARGDNQIYCHIQKDNEKSIGAFEAVGMQEVDYILRVDHWQ
jgi:RimJ/RimL family protein N-acetyltransferase